MRLMASPDDFAGPVNIGNPGEFTIGELAEIVVGMTGSPSSISYLPRTQDDPQQRRPDISLAKSALGWEPRVSLRDGLLPTIEYFRDLL